MALNWFYDKEIKVLEQAEGYLHRGSWVDGGLVEKLEITCDVQPSNRELIFREYGFYIECAIRIFCDVVDIAVGDIVECAEQRYKVVKVVKWDDYLDIFAEDYADGK